jgi:hypothetical protein
MAVYQMYGSMVIFDISLLLTRWDLNPGFSALEAEALVIKDILKNPQRQICKKSLHLTLKAER